jgi:hypothetical protein
MNSIIQNFDQIDIHCHISPSATKLYWKLVAKADLKGNIEESYRNLAQQTRLSTNTIREASATLVQANLIHTTLMNGKTHFKILYFSQNTVSNFDTPEPATEMTVSKIDTPNPSIVSKIDTLPIFLTPSVSIFDTPEPVTEVTVSKFDTLNPSTVSKIDTLPIFPTPSVSIFLMLPFFVVLVKTIFRGSD